MQGRDEELEFDAGGKLVRLRATRMGQGPTLLLLPALSSISTRGEMQPLQERLAGHYETVTVDWPGFGTLPRPMVDWRPEHYRTFLDQVIAAIRPSVTVAAGHAASYVLGAAADRSLDMGRLCLLSPTWRGPLPTMMNRRLDAFGTIARAVDLPLAGAVFYRLNVNGPVIRMMSRAHVYSDPAMLTPEWMAAKRAVTEAEGARHASFRFVAGELDPFEDRKKFLDAALRIGRNILMLYGAQVPPKSKAEMTALGALSNVSAVALPVGKLSFYEEFPDETAAALLRYLE